MKKVAVITTGGTIGSVLKGDSVAVDIGARRVANEIASVRSRLGCSVFVDSPINKHSEDLRPEDWAAVLAAIENACESDVDGVVVTHGTDTMAYTVAAAVACGNVWRKPVCFTGAFYPPDHPDSDASLNLMAAIEFVLSGAIARGVHMAFRREKSSSVAAVVRGIDILPMGFDRSGFDSVYDRRVADYRIAEGLDVTGRPDTQGPNLGVSAIPSGEHFRNANARVAYLQLYPGLDLSLLNDVCANRDLLVLDLYHSGTGPADGSADLLSFLEGSVGGVEVAMGAFPRAYIDVPYTSSVVLKKAGGRLFGDLPGHFLYAFAVTGLAAGLSVEELLVRLGEYEL